MKQFLSILTVAFFAVIASASFSMQASASSPLNGSGLKSLNGFSSSILQPVHYQSWSHDEDEEYDEDEYEDEEEDYRPRKHYRKRKHHYRRKRCYTKYVTKYVCEYPKPRCLKQRECIWSYGKEYCRYVRKCTHAEKSCEYVKVPHRKCW